jgi:mRNA-degrading endonuclease toxin of MazEF toxin-antitoxin module
MTPPEARLGEVWFADVPGDKRRPVLVLSRVPGSRRIVTTSPRAGVLASLCTRRSS